MNKTLIKQGALIYILVMSLIGSGYYFIAGLTIVEIVELISVATLGAGVVFGIIEIVMRYVK